MASLRLPAHEVLFLVISKLDWFCPQTDSQSLFCDIWLLTIFFLLCQQYLIFGLCEDMDSENIFTDSVF